MAYETLKGVIRQYIKTNGNNEITGQILQNVLIEMVDNYPSLAGYATQSWVWNTALSGYATQQWVQQQGYITSAALSGYATQTYVQNNRLKALVYSSADGWLTTGKINGVQLANGLTIEAIAGETDLFNLKTDVSYFDNRYLQPSAISDMATQQWVGQNYLPLTGGNLSGSLSIQNTMTLGVSTLHWEDDGEYCTLTFDSDGVTLTAHGTGYIEAREFVKTNGTSSQFLKADGSVDSSTYLTSVAFSNLTSHPTTLSGYGITDASISNGTITLGSNSITPITSLSGYATETYVQNNRLKSLVYSSSDGWQSTGKINGVQLANGLTIEAIAGETDLYNLKTDVSYFDNRYLQPSAISDMATQTWVGNQGYITSAALSGYATETWVGNNYLALTGGTLTGTLTGTTINASNFLSQSAQGHAQWGVAISTSGISVFSQDPDPLEPTLETSIGYGTITASGAVTGGSFVKTNGTSSQFLKADGSVDSNAYITSSALSGYATQQWVQQQGYITSAALSGYATQTWVGNNYLSLSDGGELEGLLVANAYIQTGKIYGFDNEALTIQGSDIDGTVMIDARSGIYLTTDGNSSWIFCEDICSLSSGNKWKITMEGSASFKNLYLYDLNIGEGNAGYGTKYLCVKNGVLKFFDGTNEKTVVLQ